MKTENEWLADPEAMLEALREAGMVASDPDEPLKAIARECVAQVCDAAGLSEVASKVRTGDRDVDFTNPSSTRHAVLQAAKAGYELGKSEQAKAADPTTFTHALQPWDGKLIPVEFVRGPDEEGDCDYQVLGEHRMKARGRLKLVGEAWSFNSAGAWIAGDENTLRLIRRPEQ